MKHNSLMPAAVMLLVGWPIIALVCLFVSTPLAWGLAVLLSLLPLWWPSASPASESQLEPPKPTLDDWPVFNQLDRKSVV